jgi:acetyltransferase
MEEANLGLFFNPRTIAIIGASDHADKVGGILMQKTLKSKCKIIPVNPSHHMLFGLKCYKSLLDYNEKEKIDLAVIAIPAAFVLKSLEECGKKGIKNVIIVSAGFSEVGKVEDEKKILEVVKKYGIRVIGPNCFGIFNAGNNLDLTFAITTPKKVNNNNRVVFISQSGALWSFISDYFNEKVNLNSFVGLGNMADLEFNDFIEHFACDKNTSSIILYIEKLKDGRRFIDVCRNAVEKGKKIYAVKAGSSEKGSEAAFSHTASLASDYLIYKGVFKQAKVVQCNTLEEAIALASSIKLEKNKKPKLKIKGKAFIITNAGGAGALVSDILSEKKISIVEKSLDIIGTALSSDYLSAFEKNKDKAENFFFILTAQSMSDIEKTAEVICKIQEQNKNKMIVALFLGGEVMKEASKIFEKNKVAWFKDFEGLESSL